MNKQKELWEKLAKENSKYYIYSDRGRGITEEQFRKSGLFSYKSLIADDKLITGRESILDFGCGNGRLTEFMAQDFKTVYGVDISKTMIAEAQERLGGLMNVYLSEIDGIHIPLPTKSVETVFSYLVFQHMKERGMVEKAFAEIFRILKNGGVFKVLMRSDKQKDMSRWWSGVEYDEESIRNMYEPLGFGLIRIEHLDKYAYWLWLQKQSR